MAAVGTGAIKPALSHDVGRFVGLRCHERALNRIWGARRELFGTGAR